MAKDYKFALLLDYYGDMLTPKQRDVLDLYYNEDMSLAEIAEHERITRQGVHDSIHRGEQLLAELEEKLAFAEKMRKYEDILEDIKALSENIYTECRTYNYSKSISQNASMIIEAIKSLDE
ncbi:MAG: DNA-binding protein [Oscillospiraceae bacterium]|nr:DNA-binding protein [Oscillospiraceae bacterium]